MNEEALDWLFYAFVVLSFCCSAAGFATAERGWYVVAACMAAGALVAAVALAVVEPPGAAA